MHEAAIERYLVDRVKALGGFALKGDLPGRRFIDRICVLPDGVVLWVEVKRPSGGRRTKLQEKIIADLLELGHFAFFVKTKEEVDLVLGCPKVFYNNALRIVPPKAPLVPSYVSTPKGLVDASP